MRADVVALVSLGRHPVSKRPRKADLDARALELALGCAPTVMALHAGPAETGGTAALRDYVGAGAARLVILDCVAEADPLPAIAAWLRTEAPRLIVAGVRAEAGECSGMTPFWLAERLDYGVATEIVAIDLRGETARLVQALPGGRRRALETSLPLIVTVGRTGPEPRLSARMRALRGTLDVRSSGPTDIDLRTRWSTRPSRPRPKRLAAPKAAGQDGGSETDQRRELIAPSPDVAADAILDFLDRDGLLVPNTSHAAKELKP